MSVDHSPMCRAMYSDGRVIPARPGEEAVPKPCAGVPGTIINVEDLFYNIPTRLKALKNPSEEYARILDVVCRYAIHYAGVAITCKKVCSKFILTPLHFLRKEKKIEMWYSALQAGNLPPDVQTQKNASVIDNIRSIHGPAVARELLAVSGDDQSLAGQEENEDVDVEACATADSNVASTSSSRQRPVFRVKGYVTNGNYSHKRGVFIFFINGLQNWRLLSGSVAVHALLCVDDAIPRTFGRLPEFEARIGGVVQFVSPQNR